MEKFKEVETGSVIPESPIALAERCTETGTDVMSITEEEGFFYVITEKSSGATETMAFDTLPEARDYFNTLIG